MPTIHRVQAGTLPASVFGRPSIPLALDFVAVQRARIPQSSSLPGYTGRRSGVTTRTPAIYAAAETWGFRYPGVRRAPKDTIR